MNISGFIYMVLKQRIMYLKCLFLYSVHWYVHIKKVRVCKSVSNCINARGLSDQWICSMRFSSIEALSAV